MPELGGITMKKRVMVILAPGFEEIEAVCVIDILRRAKVNVQICSTDKEFVKGSHNITIKSDARLEFIDIYNDEYDLIYLPGGVPGVNHLAESEDVMNLLKKYNEDRVLIGAICAAPWVLDQAGIIKEHEVTSAPTFKDKISPKSYQEKVFVTSGNILTSRGAGTSMEMGFKLLEALGLEEEAKRLREDMQYNFLMENIAEDNT